MDRGSTGQPPSRSHPAAHEDLLPGGRGQRYRVDRRRTVHSLGNHADHTAEHAHGHGYPGDPARRPTAVQRLAAREVRALRWPGRLYCSASAGYPGFLELAGPAAEGVRVVAPWLLLAERVPDTQPNSWAIRKFVAGFTPRHGPIGAFAGYGADALTMVHHAYAGHRDRQRARYTLKHMAHTGVTGVYRTTPGNHAGLDNNAITIIVVRNGSWAIDDSNP